MLNTYYGAQAFENWGLTSMVALVVGSSKSIYIATESPKIKEKGLIEFSVSDTKAYRAVSKKTIILPQEGTVTIDFKNVYGKGFNNGLKKNK